MTAMASVRSAPIPTVSAFAASPSISGEVNRHAELEVFVQVAERGGFSAAARLRGSTPSAISKTVARLEARLGVQLLRRSTRRLELTAEGAQLLAQGRPLLDEWRALEQSVARQAQPQGVVRINASTATGQRLLVPLVPELMQTWPGLQLDLSFTDHVVDLIEARADIAIRWGQLPSSDMVARRLGQTRQVIVGAPTYLQRHGRPQQPTDLAGHVRIGWNYPRAVPHWPLRTHGQLLSTTMGELLRVNDGEAMRALALVGAGLARLSLYHAWDDLHAGRLQAVLEDCNPGDLEPIHAVYVGKPTQLPVRTRAVLDFLQRRINLRYAEQFPAELRL